jgi:hypothetical protein
MSVLKTVSLVAVLTGGGLAFMGVASAASDEAAGGAAAEAATTTTAPAPGSAPTVAGPGVGAMAVSGPFEVTLLAVEDPVVPDDEIFGPDPGNRFVGVELELRNTSSEVQSFSSLLSAEVVDGLGQSWTPSLFAVSDRSQLDGDVPAGESRRGWIGFEVPEASTGLRLFINAEVFGGGAPAEFALDAAAAAPTTTAA